MSKKVSSPRKPPVAFRNAKKAEENIRLKLDVLEHLLNDFKLTPDSSLPHTEPLSNLSIKLDFPRSLRQFNFWDSQKGPFYGNLVASNVFRNSNETLKSHPELRFRVESVIASLIDVSRNLNHTKKAKGISYYKSQLAQAEKLRGILEVKLIEMQRTIQDLQRQLQIEQQKHQQLKDQFRHEVQKAKLVTSDLPSAKATVSRIRK